MIGLSPTRATSATRGSDRTGNRGAPARRAVADSPKCDGFLHGPGAAEPTNPRPVVLVRWAGGSPKLDSRCAKRQRPRTVDGWNTRGSWLLCVQNVAAGFGEDAQGFFKMSHRRSAPGSSRRRRRFSSWSCSKVCAPLAGGATAN